MATNVLSYLGYGPGRTAKPVRLVATACFVAGGLLVLWSAYIHFHLWNETDGYRHISVIGPLFLAQSIGGLIIGIGVIAVRRVWAAIVGAGYGASTIVGFLLTVGLPKGLFNFKESWSAPFADQAFAIEIAVTVVLVLAGALCLTRSASTMRTGPALAGHAPSGA